MVIILYIKNVVYFCIQCQEKKIVIFLKSMNENTKVFVEPYANRHPLLSVENNTLELAKEFFIGESMGTGCSNLVLHYILPFNVCQKKNKNKPE